MADDDHILWRRAIGNQPIKGRAGVCRQATLARGPRTVCEPAIIDRQDVGLELGCVGGVVFDTVRNCAGGGVSVQEEHRGARAERFGNVGLRSRGRWWERQRVVVDVGENEPSAERVVVRGGDSKVEGLAGCLESV